MGTFMVVLFFILLLFTSGFLFLAIRFAVKDILSSDKLDKQSLSILILYSIISIGWVFVVIHCLYIFNFLKL